MCVIIWAVEVSAVKQPPIQGYSRMTITLLSGNLFFKTIYQRFGNTNINSNTLPSRFVSTYGTQFLLKHDPTQQDTILEHYRVNKSFRKHPQKIYSTRGSCFCGTVIASFLIFKGESNERNRKSF